MWKFKLLKKESGKSAVLRYEREAFKSQTFMAAEVKQLLDVGGAGDKGHGGCAHSSPLYFLLLISVLHPAFESFEERLSQ